MNERAMMRLLRAVFKDDPVTDDEILSERRAQKRMRNCPAVQNSYIYLDQEYKNCRGDEIPDWGIIFEELRVDDSKKQIAEMDLADLVARVRAEIEIALLSSPSRNEKSVGTALYVFDGMCMGTSHTEMATQLHLSRMRVGQIVRQLHKLDPMERLRKELQSYGRR